MIISLTKVSLIKLPYLLLQRSKLGFYITFNSQVTCSMFHYLLFLVVLLLPNIAKQSEFHLASEKKFVVVSAKKIIVSFHVKHSTEPLLSVLIG